MGIDQKPEPDSMGNYSKALRSEKPETGGALQYPNMDPQEGVAHPGDLMLSPNGQYLCFDSTWLPKLVGF
jgi:hypothetical protein